MKRFMTVNKSHFNRIAVTVLIAAVLVACLLVCFACGYIFVSVSGITAIYNGQAVEVGGSIDENDVTVTAKYSDNTSKAVSGFKLSYDFSVAGDRLVTVTYSEMGKSVSTNFTVEVKEKTPEPLAVTLDNITAVYNGEAIETGGSLNKEDITVTAHYSDNSDKSVTNFDVSGFSSASAGNKTVTVTYTENGVTKTTTITVVVKEPPITLLSINAVYNGQSVLVCGTLSKEDIEVTAHYSDGGSAAVTDYTLSGFDSSSAGEKTVTVTYTEYGVTKTCNFNVTVSVPPVTLESITAVYNGAAIKVGGVLNNDDITVTAFYSDESSKAVTNFAVGVFSSAKAGVCDVTVSYSENGVTKETILSITIVENSQGVVSESNLSIHFLELGNQNTGDCVYIKAGDTDILIDAGSRKNSAGTLINYINKYVTDNTLEYVIVTHEHQDHISGFMGLSGQKGIFKQYVCENIIDFPRYNSSLTTDSGADSLLAEYLNARDAEIAEGANHYTALDCVNNANGAQKVYDLTGDGSITMEVLNQRYYSEKSSDPNNYSVCVMISQKVSDTQTNNYLFTGDLEESGEKSLVESNPDLPKMKLFKGGHHGSYTASNDVLLQKIEPEYVCICCCAGNVEYTQDMAHTFPAQEMIDRVAKYTDNVYVTTLGKIKENGTNTDGSIKWANDGYESMNGNIVFSCVNGVITLNCSNNNLKLKDTQWFKANRKCPPEWEQTIE